MPIQKFFSRRFLYTSIFLCAVSFSLIGCGDGDDGGGGSSTKVITAFSLNEVVGTINEAPKTIAVTVPFGTDVTTLVATFTTTGVSVQVVGTNQTSGTTVNDFTNPVTYTITAVDGSTVDYTVTVTVALSSAKAITTFALAGATGTINEAPKTIAVTVPFGTDVTTLVATFTTTGVSVQVVGTNQTSGTTVNDFTNPATYTITAADGSTVDYLVTVTVNTAWQITSFPGELFGSWFSDFDGSFQWDIFGSTTIRTFNRFFSVHSTYIRPGVEIEYKVITTEGGRWHTFFFKNVTASHMQATFTNCPSSPTGFGTENEALGASSVYNQFCNGNHK